MHEYRPLDERDIGILKSEIRLGVLGQVYLFVGLFLALAAVFYMDGDFDVDDLWIYAALSLAVTSVIGVFFGFLVRRVRRDLREGQKLCGRAVLEKRVYVITRTGKTYYFFQTHLDGEREFAVDRDVYNRFIEGDGLYLEIAPHTGMALRLERAE